jgi:anti-sigma-K factor RskA
MTDHAQYADALALYALGALDDPRESADVQAHLGTCGECRRELEALRADMALLALSATGPQPPQRARQRLLAAIAAEPRERRRARPQLVVGRLRSRWWSLAPIGVALMLAIFSMLLWRDVRNTRHALRQTEARLAQTENQMQQMSLDYAQARAVADLLHAPDAQHLTLVSAKTRPQPQMKTIYSPQKGTVMLLASNVPPPPSNKVYQLWLLPMDGSAPMPAGLFKPDTSGNGMMMHPMSSAGISAKGFAITIEPESGSQTPTMPIVMATAG